MGKSQLVENKLKLKLPPHQCQQFAHKASMLHVEVHFQYVGICVYLPPHDQNPPYQAGDAYKKTEF